VLELQSLLLRAWTIVPNRRAGGAAAGTVGARSRAVVDPATGQPLGCARVPAGTGPWWRRLTRAVLEVYETEDESLLFTVHRAWPLALRWEVRDSEGRRLGTFRRSDLRAARQAMRLRERHGSHGQRIGHSRGGAGDRTGQSPIVIDPPPVGPAADAAASAVQDLVTWSHSHSGTLVTFAGELEGKPFAKMVVLAAVLTADG
jgi:hypothetical protein